MKNEAILKDKLLRSLYPESSGAFRNRSSHELAEILQIQEYQVLYLIDFLLHDANIKTLETTGPNSSQLGSFFVMITHKGMAFLDFGGYRKAVKKERLNTYWKCIVIVASTLNAVLVLGIAFWGLQVQIKANNKEANSRDREEIKEWLTLFVDIAKDLKAHKVDTIVIKNKNTPN